jgi:hypothetical protein
VNVIEVTEELAKLDVAGARVFGVQFRWDDDLHATIADVLWIVPEPPFGGAWKLDELDRLCESARTVLHGLAEDVYCRYRTTSEFAATREKDLAYFLPVNNVAA